MNDSGENTAIADDSGRYSIKVASGVWWKVHARTDQAVGYPETFTPSGAAPVRDLEIQPAALVRGRVLDMRGATVAGAVVSIEVDPTVRGLLESALPLSATADDDGRYELPALPGAILVKGVRGMQQGVGLATTLAPGETAEVDVTLRDPIEVTGRVVRADLEPVAGAKIHAATTISPGGPTEKLQFDSGDDGGFRFTMPAGWVRLEARHGGERSATSAQWVDSGKRLDDVVITITEPVALRGTIVTTDGTPVSGARVRLSAHAVYDTTSNGDGSFEAAAFPDQAYTVKIKHSDGQVTRVVAAWNGEERFVMRQFGSLQVRIANEQTATVAIDATVTIDSFLPEGEALPRTPAEARFRGTEEILLDHLEPGHYDLTIAAKGFASAQRSRLHVTEGTRQSVSVNLAAPTVVRGVVRSSGQPVSGAQITVAARIAYSDAKGRWSIGDVTAGPVAIVVAKQGFGKAWVSATAGDDAAPIEIELRQGGDGVVDGVGVTLSPGPTGVRITSVLPGSPADGKLVAGDVIEAVDGTAVATSAVEEIVARLRGSAGSSVSITVLRGSDSPKFDVVRRRLVVPQGTPAIAIAAARAGGRGC